MTDLKPGRRLALSGLLLTCAIPWAVHFQPDAAAARLIRLAAADTTSDDEASRTGGSLGTVEAYRLALLEMKGHLSVARTLVQLGEPGADYHLQQPIRKIFRSIRPELDARKAPLTSDILVQLERVTQTSPQAALTTLDSAAAAIDGSFAQPGAVAARSALALSEALLRAAVRHYASSVADNAVTDLHGYQTGRGFVIQAEALVRHSTGLKSRPGYEALLADVVLIRQAWPGVMPPPIVFDPQSVSQRLDDAAAIIAGMK